MKTNELKKGHWVRLKNGWLAEIWDNRKGNLRDAKVYGFVTEIGSVYAHDIAYYLGSGPQGTPVPITHTPAQVKARATIEKILPRR